MPELSAPAPYDSGGDPVDLAIQYALDAVSDAERAEIENWLRTAEPGAARMFDETVREVRETLGALAALDAQEPPARLEGRILAALDVRSEANTEVRHTDPPGNSSPPETVATVTPFRRITDHAGPPDEDRRTGEESVAAATAVSRRRTRQWRRLAASAAAVVVAAGIGIGIALVEQRSGDEAGGAVTAQEIHERADTRSLSTEISGGTFTVHISAELGAATVAFSQLPAPPAGSDYQLWLIDAAGDPRSAGVLADLPEAAAPYVTEVTGPGTLAVTLEPDGGSPAPTSDPLGAVELG